MKNLFKNIVFISAILLFALILGFFSNVFAIDYTDENNNIFEIPISDEHDYIVLRIENTNIIHMIFIDNLETINFNYNNNTIYFNENTTFSVYKRNFDTQSSWNYSTYTMDFYQIASSFQPILSSYDFYDMNNNLVFPPAPQGQTILAPIVEQAETEKVTAEIVGILPIILVLLVSILAIYKAIRLLRNVLKTS